MSQQKICRDCANYNELGDLCVRGKCVVGHDYVHGEPIYRYKVLVNPREERYSWLPWKCGKNARYFKEKSCNQ